MPDAMSISDALGNAGELPSIEWNGKTYRVAHATPKAVQRAEEQVAKQATEAVLKLKGVLSPEAFAESWASVAAAVQTGQHGFGKSLYQAAMSGVDGLLLPFLACVRERHPELTMADAKAMYGDHPDEIDLILSRVGVGFFTHGVAGMAATPAQKAAAVADLLAFQAAQVAGLKASRAA